MCSKLHRLLLFFLTREESFKFAFLFIIGEHIIPVRVDTPEIPALGFRCDGYVVSAGIVPQDGFFQANSANVSELVVSPRDIEKKHPAVFRRIRRYTERFSDYMVGGKT